MRIEKSHGMSISNSMDMPPDTNVINEEGSLGEGWYDNLDNTIV
jgi:hypothetical protein